MTSTRPVRSIVLFGTCLCGLSACTSVLLNTPVFKTSDGWSITLSEVKEGPDEYVGEVSTIIPEEGEKFIWTLVTVKNDGAQEQTFAYETCMLQGPGVSRPPAILDRHAELQHSAADPEEAYEPGVQRVRELIYKFPKAQRPTRMKCGTIVLPIPTKK